MCKFVIALVCICVGKTEKKDFNSYVDACAEKGFSTISSRGDGFYYATNQEGYRLFLEYEENDTMTVTIKEPALKVTKEGDTSIDGTAKFEVFVVTNFTDINEDTHTVQVVMLGKDSQSHWNG